MHIYKSLLLSSSLVGMYWYADTQYIPTGRFSGGRMITECCYCGKIISRDDLACYGVSHGICKVCSFKMMSRYWIKLYFKKFENWIKKII